MKYSVLKYQFKFSYKNTSTVQKGLPSHQLLVLLLMEIDRFALGKSVQLKEGFLKYQHFELFLPT